jgi:glycosyltransferase involved in cell wall biosynthesis
MPGLLILCEYPTLLGGERSMLATLPAIAAAGYEIHVAAPPNGPLAAALEERGVNRVDWPEASRRATMLPSQSLRAELAGVVRSVAPDLIHANSLSTSRISGPVAAEARIPSLAHLRDILKLSRRAVDEINLHRRTIAVSHATRDFHIAQGLDAARSAVAYNGIDLDEFRPRRPTGFVHRELRLPPAARLVATIGQLSLRKATHVALQAARRLAAELPELHWLIVGERTSNKLESRLMEAKLHGLASQPPLAGRVHFLGSRGDVPQILNECVLLVHAARQEPLGRVLLEAAASRLAVVATDVGGTREIFPSDADGAILVPPDNPAALAGAVLTLLASNERRQSLAENTRRRAEQAFDIRLAAARLIELYQCVMI